MKSRKYYIKLIIGTAIIALVPIMIISMLSYISIKRNIEIQLNDTTQVYLKQCENAIDIIFKQVDQSIHQLIIDSDFKEFENFYTGKYYEMTSDGFKEEEFPILYSYLTKKAKILEKLSVYRSANHFVESVYFYDTDKDIILTDNKLQYKLEEFYDQEWLALTKDIQLFPTILNTRSVTGYEGKTKNVVSVIYKTVNVLDGNNFVVINIDQEYLFDSLSNEVQDRLGRVLFIVSKDNQMIVKGPEDKIYKTILEESQIQDDLEGDLGIVKKKVEGEKYIINFTQNHKLNWIFVTALKQNQFYKGIYAVRNLFFFFTLFIIALTIGVVIICSKRMYSPILNIINFIKNNISSDELLESEGEELDLISQSLKSVYTNYTDMCNKLQENLPHYKEQFMYALLRYHTYTYDEIVDKFKFTGIDLETENLVVTLIQIEHINRKLTDSSLGEDDISRIKKIIEKNMNNYFKGIVLRGEPNQFILVLHVDKEQFNNIFKLSEHLKSDLAKEVHIKVSLGISRICEEITYLAQGYIQANEALKYRDLSNCYDVIYIEDIKIRNRQFMIYPKEKVEMINNYIRIGNKEEALNAFKMMMTELMTDNQNAYYSDIQRIFIRFLNSITSTINALGLELNDIFPEENTYQIFLQMHTIEQIQEWFEEMIVGISDYILSAVDDKKNKYIKEIDHYLETHSLKDVTLNAVAEHLELNPSYVSKVFKEHMGKGFTEYLTEYKVKKSKEILTHTDLKIQDICTEMGYSNSYYFIKIFKKMTGLTPGEYRKCQTMDN